MINESTHSASIIMTEIMETFQRGLMISETVWMPGNHLIAIWRFKQYWKWGVHIFCEMENCGPI